MLEYSEKFGLNEAAMLKWGETSSAREGCTEPVVESTPKCLDLSSRLKRVQKSLSRKPRSKSGSKGPKIGRVLEETYVSSNNRLKPSPEGQS